MRISLPNRSIVVSTAVLICLLLTVSCVTDKDFYYLNDQIVALNKRVDSLSKDVVSIREQQAKGDVDVKKVREDMEIVQGRLDENNRLVRRAVEKDTRTQDGMGTNITDLQNRISRLDMDVRQINAYLNLQPASALPQEETQEKPQAGPMTKAESSVPVVQLPEKAPAKPEGLSEQQIYDGVMILYRENKYEEAASGFKNFVAKYPKSDLADNAQFWEGESYMALKQYEQAILAYQRVIKNYPKGNKVPNAILRQALAFNEINDKTSCKLLLKKLISQYPNSNEAKIATARLKTMN